MERQRLIIIGAGGLGRVIYDLLLHDSEICRSYDLEGFLDNRTELDLPSDLDGKVLESPLSYKICPKDVFLPAVGNTFLRRKLITPLINQDAIFFNYINRASIASRTTIGQGVFIGPGAAISTDCEIGNYCCIDSYSIIGHDVKIGSNCMIGAMSFLAGGVVAKEGVTIHPRSTIAKDVVLGDYCTIGMGAVVLKDVPPYTTVFGNPARVVYTKKNEHHEK